MYYLYGTKPGAPPRLAATFDSEPQLLAYVRWATLYSRPGEPSKYEQGSALAGYTGFQQSAVPLTDDAQDEVFHNPSPSML